MKGDLWQTPPYLYAALDREFRFRLDAACTVATCLAERGLCLDRGQDGLTAPWCPGPVYVNPPYSSIPPWLAQADRHRGETVVMLLPVRTSTEWWREIAACASEVRFICGNLRFRGARGNAPEDSAIVVYDDRPGPPVHLYVDHDDPRRVLPVDRGSPRAGWRRRAMARILYSLRAGRTITASATFGGVSRATVYRWRQAYEDFEACFRTQT